MFNDLDGFQRVSNFQTMKQWPLDQDFLLKDLMFFF
jgi:hypothetical protein